MVRINIDNLQLEPLKIIAGDKGDVFRVIRKTDDFFFGFEEAYFSTVKYNKIKGWNMHKSMTLNLVVPSGKVNFVIYDNRKTSKSYGNFFSVCLSPENYQRLVVPPGLFVAFRGEKIGTSLILNISNMVHSDDEIEKVDLQDIEYNWPNL